MTDLIALTGIVATIPRALKTGAGLSITSFRLASAQRRFDRSKNAWVDTDTNWYTVTAFRGLAENAAASLAKGDRVVVTGRLRIRAWENEERSGTTVEVDADAIGHDLHWCTTRSTRITAAAPTSSDDESGTPEDESAQSGADEQSSDTVSDESAPDAPAPASDEVGGAVAQTAFADPAPGSSAWDDEEAPRPF